MDYPKNDKVYERARGRRKWCTRTSSGHALHTNASFSFEAAQIEREREREREDPDHPLVSKAAHKGIPLKNARVLPTSSHSRPKKKERKSHRLEIRAQTTSTYRLLDETVGLTDATTVLAVKVSAIFVRIISFSGV